MCNYLQNRGGTYYFRRAIPRELRLCFDDAPQWMFSLRTKDYAEGKRLARAEGVRTDDLIDSARAELAAGPPSASASIPASADHLAMTEEEQARLEAQGWESAAQDERRIERAPLVKKIEGEFRRRSTAQLTRREAAMRDMIRERDDALAFAHARLTQADAGARQVAHTLSAATISAVEVAPEPNDLAPLNAADGVKIKDTRAASNKRLPFDLAALNRIMTGPVHADNLRPVQGRGEAAYWLPLLALFTGARVEELGQLRPSDVTQIIYPDDNGVDRKGWFLRITEDEEEGLRIKNAGSERLVPLHPELERLGFIAFVDAMRKARHARLFYLLRPDKYGRYTAKWGEWWSAYMRAECGVSDRRMVFHSFRHTFKHYAGHVGMIEGVQRQIMGHSPGDVADEYRGGYSLFQLVEGMSRYRVAGLKLPEPQTLSV